MRLIDADAIPFRREIGDLSECPKMFVSKNTVDHLPTIDPASLRPKGEWISIEDRLPEYGQYVIVYTGRMMEGSVGAMYFWHEAYDIWQPVSHWMPLPEPPNMRGSV